MNTQYSSDRVWVSTLACLWIERFSLSFTLLPWDQFIHPTKEKLFAGFTAFAGKLAIRERQLLAHEVKASNGNEGVIVSC